MVQTDMKKIVIICGLTASGKTRLAIELAQQHNGEIVSADSGQVWRELDLGTAKPTPEDQRRIPHHLIDVATPGEHFDVSQYVALADKAITDITGRGKMPFVVGGTGMYLRVLLHGLCEAPKQDAALRAQLEEKIKKLKPSARGELEVTDLNNVYVLEGTMICKMLTSWWVDAGTSFDELLKANSLVAQEIKKEK